MATENKVILPTTAVAFILLWAIALTYLYGKSAREQEANNAIITDCGLEGLRIHSGPMSRVDSLEDLSAGTPCTFVKASIRRGSYEPTTLDLPSGTYTLTNVDRWSVKRNVP